MSIRSVLTRRIPSEAPEIKADYSSFLSSYSLEGLMSQPE